MAEFCSAAAGPSRRYRGLVLRRRLHTQPPEFRLKLSEHGVEREGPLKFRLVAADGLNLSQELVESITQERCLSRDLFLFGFLVVEETTGFPIVVRLP